MSSLQCLRRLIFGRLTAAAEEIFTQVERIVVEYEDEVNRQRELLEFVYEPKVRLERIELPPEDVLQEEEVLTEQQLWNQERNSSLDQEEPESVQIKEEEEEICSSQEQEQLELKQEADTFIVGFDDEESDHIDHQLLSAVAESQDQTGREDAEMTVDESMKMLWKPEVKLLQTELPQQHFYHEVEESDHMEPEPDTDHQLLSAVAETQDQTGNLVEKPHMCDICRKCFARKHSLMLHQRTHTGEKPHVCDICKKGFSSPHGLKYHLRIHTGEKPYSCETCGKCFRQSSSLVTHRRTHAELPQQHVYHEDEESDHEFLSAVAESRDQTGNTRNVTGEKRHMCDICKKRFTRKRTLMFHQRTHTGEKPHMCVICKKGFTSKHGLKYHLRTHTGEKPYCCETCGKCFRQSSPLVIHRRTHTGEKPHVCSVCTQCFRHKSALNQHMRSHTGENLC